MRRNQSWQGMWSRPVGPRRGCSMLHRKGALRVTLLPPRAAESPRHDVAVVLGCSVVDKLAPDLLCPDKWGTSGTYSDVRRAEKVQPKQHVVPYGCHVDAPVQGTVTDSHLHQNTTLSIHILASFGITQFHRKGAWIIYPSQFLVEPPGQDGDGGRCVDCGLYRLPVDLYRGQECGSPAAALSYIQGLKATLKEGGG